MREFKNIKKLKVSTSVINCLVYYVKMQNIEHYSLKNNYNQSL